MAQKPTLQQSDYQTGRAAFERGRYREAITKFEQAIAAGSTWTPLTGEITLWLVMAHAALGEQEAATTLCRTLERHPDLNIRKQGTRLLYILEAPHLETRAVWIVQIPDLSGVTEEGEAQFKWASSNTYTANSATAQPAKRVSEPVAVDANTQDNQFVWVALVGAIAAIAGLVWFG
ncbi:MAG: tetratricopeptide repeat protein [Cyanobacteria bacterium P01_H01_bin.121]